jgi:hypothetical protein
MVCRQHGLAHIPYHAHIDARLQYLMDDLPIVGAAVLYFIDQDFIEVLFTALMPELQKDQASFAMHGFNNFAPSSDLRLGRPRAY